MLHPNAARNANTRPGRSVPEWGKVGGSPNVPSDYFKFYLRGRHKEWAYIDNCVVCDADMVYVCNKEGERPPERFVCDACNTTIPTGEKGLCQNGDAES